MSVEYYVVVLHVRKMNRKEMFELPKNENDKIHRVVCSIFVVINYLRKTYSMRKTPKHYL